MKNYKLTEADRGTGMTCPRPECGGKFLVNLPKLIAVKEEQGVRTAMCPYCSKVSAVPGLAPASGTPADEYLGPADKA